MYLQSDTPLSNRRSMTPLSFSSNRMAQGMAALTLGKEKKLTFYYAERERYTYPIVFIRSVTNEGIL